MTASFLASLAKSATPYALLFAGQGSAWQDTLKAALAYPGSANRLHSAWAKARKLIEPVSLDLMTRAPAALHRVDTLLEGKFEVEPGDRDAAVSTAGIALAQLAATARVPCWDIPKACWVRRWRKRCRRVRKIESTRFWRYPYSLATPRRQLRAPKVLVLAVSSLPCCPFGAWT